MLAEQSAFRQLVAFVEQFIDRPDTRRWCAQLGGCPTYSGDQPQLRGDAATFLNIRERQRFST
jgi:hypothetical protein